MYALSGYGDAAADLQDRVTFLTGQLRAIGIAAQQAKARGDAADLATLLTLYRKVAGQVAALRDQLPTGMPSAFLRSVADLGDQVAAVGRDAFGVVGNVAKGVGATVKWLPALLALGLGVLGVGLYKGTVSVRR